MQLHIAELSRRGVFKTLVAYAVAAWVLTEVTSVIAPAFLLPDWTVAAVTTVLVLAAFPVILLSWRYDFTLEGIKRDTRSLSKPAERSARMISSLIIVVLLSVIATLWVNYFRARSDDVLETMIQAQQGAPEIGEAGRIESIAVLPFDDYSPEGGRQLLADGIAEAILHVLAQNKELVVTARKSSFMFRDKDVSATEIGRILNVQALLEGSIQIAGDRLRVTSQLIRTSDQAHIWSNVYEAPLDNIFKVNDEIAAEVRNLILPRDKSSPGPAGQIHPPSVEAWQLVLEARELIGDLESTERAIGILNVVIGLWPDYADAHAWLAMAYYDKAGELDRTHTAAGSVIDNMRNRGLQAAESALDLDPNNHLAILVKGLETTGRTVEKYHEAIRTVYELAPNDPDVLNWLAGLANYSANYERAKEFLSRARAVDPANLDVLESYLGSTCGAGTALPMVDDHLDNYPVPRIKALGLRGFGQYCDRQFVDAISTLIELARIDSDPVSSFRALLLLAGLGDDRALALLGAAHRLHPGKLNASNDGIFNPSYFTEILAERLDTYRRHARAGFPSGESDMMHAMTLMMAGDFASAETIVERVRNYWDRVYSAEEGRFWQNRTLKVYAFKAWLMARNGETGEAAEIAADLLLGLEDRNIVDWPGSQGRLADLPLMILLLNGRERQAVEWLQDAEQDRWPFFQPVLTSPVYEEFRTLPEVAESLASMVDRRAGVLAELKARDLPEVADPVLLLEMMESLVRPTHHESAQIALHFDDDPAGALQHFERALEQDPDNPEFVVQVADLALELGLVQEAVRLRERYAALQPGSPQHYMSSFTYACAGRWADAVASARKTVELGPEIPSAQRLLGMVLLLNDELQAGLEVMADIEDERHRMMGMTVAHCAVGQKAEADAIFKKWIEFGGAGPPFHLAYSLAYCDEPDLAFEWLNKAAAIGSAASIAHVHPMLLKLHDDPRWLPFLESIGKSPEQLAGIEFNIDLPD